MLEFIVQDMSKITVGFFVILLCVITIFNIRMRSAANDRESKNILKILQGEISLRSIPREHRTTRLCEIAVQKHYTEILYVPDHILSTKMIRSALRQSENALDDLPNKHFTKENCEFAVHLFPNALRWVPPVMLTKRICTMAYSKDTSSAKYIPKDLLQEIKSEIGDRDCSD